MSKDKNKLSGPYARDDHREGFGDDYARDGGWSGAGRAKDVVHDVHPDEDHLKENNDGSPDTTPPRE
jgi:hypothetical protein